ncbi:MAG: peptide chain release factor N(5)-glutamine methyltransferase [Bryobacter sp.]|nr:peptide chain release factor N(5)-glutamine methyltransferase [Bryobacter sp.]
MQGIALLREHGVEPARLTAELLLGHALGRDKVYLLTHSGEALSELGWIHYGRYLHERTAGKPVQYILGKQEFFGREFWVKPGVLIPRPETEHLVEYILGTPEARGKMVDAGVGSGTIAVTLAAELGRAVVGVDRETEPLAVTRENARRHGARVELFQSDWLGALRPGSVDVLVSNPPYIAERDRAGLQREVKEWEPAAALFAGEDGLAAYTVLARQAWEVVRPGGYLALEIGSERAAEYFREYREVRISPDLAGRPCLLTARR